MIHPAFIYLAFLFIITVLSALLLNGWYAITRGRLEVRPDGSRERKGKLFMGWHFFWTQETGKKKVYFTGVQMYQLYSRLRGLVKPENVHLLVFEQKNGIAEANHVYVSKGCVTEEVQIDFLNNLDVRMNIENHTETSDCITFYKEFPVYRFSEKLQDVLSECIYCFASIYGLLIFGTFHLLTIGSGFYELVYGWMSASWIGIILTFIVYAISLSYMNGYVYKKLNR